MVREPVDPHAAPILDAQAPRGGHYLPASHVQLLEKLEHLSRYSHFVQVVVAVAGAGKTTLLQQFMPSEDDSSVHACVVSATPDMGAGALLSELVEGLHLDLAVTASDEDKLQALYKHADLLQDIARQFLIVVDDAEQLSEEAMGVLLNLLLALRNPESRPHLVFFASPKVRELLERPRFQAVTESSCHFVELEPLSYPEMVAFIQHRYPSVFSRLDEAKLRLLHNETFGLPGRIPRVLTNLLDGKQRKETKSGSRRQMPGGALWLGCLLAAVVIAGGWFFYPSGGGNEDLQRVRVELAPPSVPSQPAAVEIPPPQPVLSLEEKLALAERRLQRSLETAENTESVEVKAEQEATAQLAPAPIRETIPAEAVAGKEVAPVAPEPDAVEAPRKLVLKLPENPPVTATPSAEQAAPDAPQASTEAETYLRENELLSWPAKGYTLQVLGARKESSVIEFIRSHKNNENLYYFYTIYKERPWYVVVYGRYLSRDQAMAAIAELPPELRERRPWARSIRGVQDDIRRKK